MRRHRETAKRSWRSRDVATFWITSLPSGARNDNALCDSRSGDGGYYGGFWGRAAADRNDRLAILRKCMSHLSREHCEIIDLVYFHEKSVSEAAAIVGATESTVKTRMFYARKRMWALLRQSGIDKIYH